jgi:hypothetical protein
VIVLTSVVFLTWIIPTYTPPYPGYGVPASLVPHVAVGIILFLAALSLCKNLLAALAMKKRGETVEEGECKDADKIYWLHLARFMIPCALLMPGMIYGGFIPAGIVFMLVMQYFCGQRKPIPMALVAVAPVLVIYAAMRWGLGVPMP